MEKLQGERFSQIMSGFDFDTASQIVILLYKSSESGFVKSWVKVAEDKYPNSELITKREDGKMIFNFDLSGLTVGKYDIEVRVDIVGLLAPIIKKRTEFITIKPSRT